MEGLEISIKKFSEVVFDNPTLRYDSEYFKKEYLKLFSTLLSNNCDKMEPLSSWITQGPNPVFNEDADIPCLTGRNINKGTVNYNNPDYLDISEYEKLKRFQLKYGDTLITLKGKGSIGKIGYVTDERKAIFSRDIGIIRPLHINSGYVNAFILSHYGKKLIERGETGGTGQSTLTTAYLKNIDIPRFSIEKKVGDLVELSEKKLSESQRKYDEAEIVLLETLGFDGFCPNKEPVNIKGFEESFNYSGRLDAEYYQLKYEDYFSLINSYSNGTESLNAICTLKDSNYNPDKEKTHNYIELANIGKAGEINGCTTDLGANLPTRARRKVNTNDVIISSIEGSLGSCALVTEEYNNALCSTGFYVLSSTRINPETLLVLFKSEPIQNLLKKGCSGTILTAIGKAELEKIPIPVLDLKVQEFIEDKIKTSFELRRKAEQLIELAKTTVEKAIEAGEEVAINWIKNNINV